MKKQGLSAEAQAKTGFAYAKKGVASIMQNGEIFLPLYYSFG